MRPLRQATGVTGGQQPAAVAQHPGVRVTEVGGERLSTGAALDAGDADDDRAVAAQAHLLVAVAELVVVRLAAPDLVERSEEHTSELQSLMRISYAAF